MCGNVDERVEAGEFTAGVQVPEHRQRFPVYTPRGQLKSVVHITDNYRDKSRCLRECFWYDPGEGGNLKATEYVVGQYEVNGTELVLVILVLLQVLRYLFQLQAP